MHPSPGGLDQQKVETAEVKTNSPAGSAKPDKKGQEGQQDARGESSVVGQRQRLKRTFVKIGISDGDYWRGREGLNEGQEIVTGGFRDGDAQAYGRTAKDPDKGRELRTPTRLLEGLTHGAHPASRQTSRHRYQMGSETTSARCVGGGRSEH